MLRSSVRVVVTVLAMRASRALASATGAGVGIADAKVPNARAEKVAIFMKENMMN